MVILLDNKHDIIIANINEQESLLRSYQPGMIQVQAPVLPVKPQNYWGVWDADGYRILIFDMQMDGYMYNITIIHRKKHSKTY